MDYIEITNWDKFQAYKDGRKIHWVKLLIEIIDEFDSKGHPKKFHKLPDLAKLAFLLLLCLRPRYSEQIPYPSTKWLKEHLGIKALRMQPLIDKGFIVIHTEPVQSRTESYESVPEIEREKEIERERERKKFTPPTLEKLQKYIQGKSYNVNAKKFLEWYTEAEWKDNKGNPVKNWKLKVISWSNRDGGGGFSAPAKKCVKCPKMGVYVQTDDAGQKYWLCEDHKSPHKPLASLPQPQMRSMADKLNQNALRNEAVKKLAGDRK